MRVFSPSVVGILVFILLGLTYAWAQEGKVSVGLLFTDGYQPQAIDLAVPAYPMEVAKHHMGGRVTVPVVIDKDGNVSVFMRALGPYPICPEVSNPDVIELRQVATVAARKSRFVPVLTPDNKPMRIAGNLVYDFLLPRRDEAVKTESTAETTPAAEPKGPPLSLIGGKAISLPKPPYPKEARAYRVSGPVAVNVLIDEQGNVTSAEAISGHPALRSASEIAACGAKFSPTLVSGTPVKVAGVINYNFVP